MKVAGSFEATEGKGMDIVNFFEKLSGTWFSQRTTHFSLGQPSQTGQTTLHMTSLAVDEPRVTALCQQVGNDAAAIAFAFAIEQEPQASTYGSQAPAPKGKTVLIGYQSADAAQGTFVSQTEQEPITQGHYHVEDEVLTLTVQTDALQSEERLWFMNPNLRMRTSFLNRADGLRMASFCSEVRRLSATK